MTAIIQLFEVHALWHSLAYTSPLIRAAFLMHILLVQCKLALVVRSVGWHRKQERVCSTTDRACP
jgi:hypothetical protein